MSSHNPIDPTTGKPRRGRPRKVQPIDTIAGPQPSEEAIPEPQREALHTAPVDPQERATTTLLQAWKDKHRSKKMLEVPEEYRKAFPDGDFCYARNSSEGISDYRANFDYEVAQLPSGTSLIPGQTDTSFKFHDVILMVRPKWKRQAHNELLREKVLDQMGKHDSKSVAEERAAYREAGGTVTFMRDEEHADDPDDPNFLREGRSRLDGETTRGSTRPRLASGTRYVSGGIPS